MYLIRLTNVRRDQLPTCHTVCFTPCDEYVCIKNTCVNKRESSLPICFSQRYIVEYFFEAHHCKLRRRRRATIYFLIHACYLMVRFITSEHNRHTNHVGGIDLSGVSTITVQSIYSGDIREQLGGLIFQSFHFSSWHTYIFINRTLTHWGRVTYVCVSKSTIIGSDTSLSPRRCQAIIWTNTVILSIRPQGTYFSEILFKIQKFSVENMYLKMSSGKWRPCCLGLHVLSSRMFS